MDFRNVSFHGVFRDYQKRVIDNANTYLKDGKINIVAAPGSGKTVLGLELIRRIGSPCIILSPTTAIRQQWGKRFYDMFLENKEDFDSLFSNDIHKARLINSITYQALYTAMEKVSESEDGDIDCSDIDILSEMKKCGIKTVCLDEAHHLKNEWQRALEKFISSLDKDVKIIALTATPPYDSDGSEWSRYTSICGEIDEEIFVPELVGQNTLCPHQDYVYFNYPTKEETEAFTEHKERARAAISEIGSMEELSELCKKINESKDYESLFSSAKEYIALLTLFRYYGFEISRRLVKELVAGKGLPLFKLSYGETAIQFLLDSELLSEDCKEKIISVLRKHQVYEKKKVFLHLTERLKRTLISSVGKLNSINKIAESEIEAMGEKLRMLVLTDYIKKENLDKISTAENFNSVNVVSIFETLRRLGKNVKIGVLSGTLIILPNSVDLSDIKHSKKEIKGTDYSVVEFSGSLHRSVDYVGKLFEKGKIQILVGTKSLLGEGWDSPCINSLILASFVGSFVLSNQMRGRAIRIDKNDPEKSANIWHLVTVEPDHLIKEKTSERISELLNRDETVLNSCDFDILKRRFDSFMGPHYDTGVIEAGIERISPIRPPYSKEGIDRINEEMLRRSRDRSLVSRKWKNEVADGKFAINVEAEIPKEKKIPVFTFWDYGILVLTSAAIASFVSAFLRAFVRSEINPIFMLLGIVLLVPATWVAGFFIKRALIHTSPVHSMKQLGIAVYRTLNECELIAPSSRVDATVDKNAHFVTLKLKNASVHDQNIFNAAITEMLSPIQNPRYILIAKHFGKKFDYRLSFACPTVIGKRKEYVEILAEKLKRLTANFVPVYAHKEEGRKLILKCRKRSYITYNERVVKGKYKVSRYE